ncbi:conserved hypothetical protein [Burkholderia ambifaria MC40-6]|uniref:Uncharacterized protein n=1 Tax=Burkholderia ambifaria (strain MC40-6) TaxID=398577 RepID=B1YRB4_BURA4|nr:conserved hypothetical protein [Burkholderia ambifaria MC40-6]
MHRIDTSNIVAKRGFTAMCRPGAHIGRLALGAAQRGLRCRTAAETPPIAQPVWRPRMRAQIVAYQQLRDIEAGPRCRPRAGRRDGRCAPRYGRLNASFLSPAHLIESRGARGAYAHARWNACARRPGTPPFQSAPRMPLHALRLANRWRVLLERRGRAAG